MYIYVCMPIYIYFLYMYVCLQYLCVNGIYFYIPAIALSLKLWIHLKSYSSLIGSYIGSIALAKAL